MISKTKYISLDLSRRNIKNISISKNDIIKYSLFKIKAGDVELFSVSGSMILTLIRDQENADFIDITSQFIEILPFEQIIHHILVLECFLKDEYITVLDDQLFRFDVSGPPELSITNFNETSSLLIIAS